MHGTSRGPGWAKRERNLLSPVSEMAGCDPHRGMSATGQCRAVRRRPLEFPSGRGDSAVLMLIATLSSSASKQHQAARVQDEIVVRCPRCGDPLEIVNGTLACRRGGMDLSEVMRAELREIIATGPAARPASSKVRWVGEWSHPDDGERMTEVEGILECLACGRFLPGRVLYQVAQFHVHAGHSGREYEPVRSSSASKHHQVIRGSQRSGASYGLPDPTSVECDDLSTSAELAICADSRPRSRWRCAGWGCNGRGSGAVRRRGRCHRRAMRARAGSRSRNGRRTLRRTGRTRRFRR
jgi:hypothetical protein